MRPEHPMTIRHRHLRTGGKDSTSQHTMAAQSRRRAPPKPRPRDTVFLIRQFMLNCTPIHCRPMRLPHVSFPQSAPLGSCRRSEPRTARMRRITKSDHRTTSFAVRLRRRSRGGRQNQYAAAIWHLVSPPHGQMSCGCEQWPMKHVPQWPDCGDTHRMTAGVAGNAMDGNTGGEYK